MLGGFLTDGSVCIFILKHISLMLLCNMLFYCIKSIFLRCILNDFYRNLVSGRKFKMMTMVTPDDVFALILTSVDKYSFTTEVYLCIYRFT